MKYELIYFNTDSWVSLKCGNFRCAVKSVDWFTQMKTALEHMTIELNTRYIRITANDKFTTIAEAENIEDLKYQVPWLFV